MFDGILKLNKKENELKYELLNLMKYKNNPFELFSNDFAEKNTEEDDNNGYDYKMELAMEYSLIYKSHFID